MNLTLSETPKTGFPASRPKFCDHVYETQTLLHTSSIGADPRSQVNAYLNILSPRLSCKLEYRLPHPHQIDSFSFTLVNLNTLDSPTQVYFWLSQVRRKSLHPSIHAQCKSHRLILLLISGIEPNPGPASRYPCGVCGHEVEDFGQPSIACNTCDQWSHKSCLGMNTSVFEAYANTSVSLFCPGCASPNHSSIDYDIPAAEDTSLGSIYSSADEDEQLSSPIRESHDTQNCDSFASSNISFVSPTATSSPKPIPPKSDTLKKSLRILNINFQSIRKKGRILMYSLIPHPLILFLVQKPGSVLIY